MAFGEMQNGLARLFTVATGLTFIWEFRSRRRPIKPYGLLRLSASRSLGRDQTFHFTGEEGVSMIAGERELSLNCQVFSKTNIPPLCARSFIEKTRMGLARPDIRDELRRLGLVYVETTPVVELDSPLAVRGETRASFDVIWSYQEAQEIQSPGYFDNVSAEGKR